MKDTATLLLLDRESIPIIRFQNDLLSKFEIKQAVTLNGWGIKSISDIDNRESIEHIKLYNVEDVFDVETLIIIKPHRYCDFERHVLKFIDQNMSTIKTIICNWADQTGYIEKLCYKNKIEYREIGYGNYAINENKGHLLQLRTPIIYVASISEMSDKFMCQQSLFQYFIDKGYSVELIGSKSYTELLGGKSFPLFMFDNTLSNSQKIIGFNHFLRDIEYVDNPDLIIVGIPGEIDGYVNGISRYFDDIIYLVSKAVKPDVTVVSMLYNEIKNNKNLENMLRYKYGWELENVFVNNMMFDSQLSLAYKKKEYVKLDDNLIENEVIELNKGGRTKFFTYAHLEIMCKNIEEQLINFGNESIV